MIRRIVGAPVLAALLMGASSPKIELGPGYQPQDRDERGLWMQMDEEERTLKTSDFVIRDPALNAYVRDVLCRSIGTEACRDVRIYLLRTAQFNASMAPNGMMVVFSGLFLRCRNEAQLAAVLLHEYTHYQRRHSLALFHNLRSKANVASVFGIFGLVGSLVQIGIVSSVYAFSREQERDADAGSIPLMANAGYDPHQASAIWAQVRAEADATAIARGTKSKKDRRGLFDDHPPTAERMATLKDLADHQPMTGSPNDSRVAYRQALAPHWATFIDDQVKLNDFGSTEFLLENLAGGDWTPELLYARGELYRMRGRPADLPAAAGFYRAAMALPGAPDEGWRGLGTVLLRMGQASEGQAALGRYLAQRPDAPDAAMVKVMAGVVS